MDNDWDGSPGAVQSLPSTKSDGSYSGVRTILLEL